MWFLRRVFYFVFLVTTVHCQEESGLRTYSCHNVSLPDSGYSYVTGRLGDAVNVLIREFRWCGWSSLMIISDGSRPVLTGAVLTAVVQCGIPFVHLDRRGDSSNDSAVQTLVREFYVSHALRHFVLVASRPADVVADAEAAFRRENRSWLSAMPHRSQWLALDWAAPDGAHACRLEPAFFDNVACAFFSKEFEFVRQPLTAFTFMWRAGRRRELQEVDLWRAGATCRMFPNAEFGLNQRHLIVLAKDDFGSFVSVENGTYVGFTLDVIGLLAERMNFTVSLEPPPGTKMSWVEYEHHMKRQEVDFGTSLYMVSYEIFHGYGITYPVKFDSVTAIYKHDSTRSVKAALVLLFPLETMHYVWVVVAVFCTAAFSTLVYLTTKKVTREQRSPRPRHPTLTSVIVQYFRHHDALNGFKANQVVSQDDTLDPAGEDCQESVVTSFWKFLASFGVFLLNQGYFWTPRSMSVRLIIGAWCLCNIVFYAAHTSSITARMVVKKIPMEFTSYEQLGQATNWGVSTLNATEILSAMQNSLSSWASLHSRLTVHQYKDWDEMLNSIDQKSVILYLEDLIKVIFQTINYPTSDVVFMNKKLMSANRGFLLPNNSELTDIMSFNLVQLHASGEIDHLYQQRINAQPATAASQDTTVRLGDVIWPFCVVLALQVVACLVLGLECGLEAAARKAKENQDRRQRPTVG